MTETKTPYKQLIIKFPNGDEFAVSAQYVATIRARYYAQIDFDAGDVPDLEAAIKAEVEYAMTDTFEIIDWIGNQMNWKDIKDVATRVADETKPDYDALFHDAKFELE